MPAIRPAPRNTEFDQPAMGDPGFFDYASNLVYDSLYHSPVASMYRFSEAMQEKRYGTGIMLSPEEATKTYGLDGELIFKEPVYETFAQLLQDRKLAELRREYELQSGSEGHWGRRIAGFGVSMASTILDPVNLASMFVPVVGEANYLQGFERAGSILGKGLISPKSVLKTVGGSRLGYRLAKGAVEGATGVGAVEPINLISSNLEQSHYDWKDSALNILFAGSMGAVMHGVGGWIGDKFRSLAEGIRSIDPQTHEAAQVSAVADIVQDRPVSSPSQILSVDPRMVQVEQQKVNIDNLISITQEHLDRLEQLRLLDKITPEQDMRRKMLHSMLNNPTSATPENLAAMFELKLSQDADKMPDAFRHVQPEKVVPAPEEKSATRTPIKFDEKQFDTEIIDRIDRSTPEEMDDYPWSSYLEDKDNRKNFVSLYKKLLSKGYDLNNAQIKQGGQSLVFITEDGKVVKFQHEKYKTIPGLNLTSEYSTKSGPFYARVVDQITPMHESLESPQIKEALKTLAVKYGLNPDDWGHWNLGMKEGKLYILDEGSMQKIGRAKQPDLSTLSPEAKAVYDSLINQIESQKQAVQQRTLDKIQSIRDAANAKVPEKVESEPKSAEITPIQKEPEPIVTQKREATVPSSEEQAIYHKEIADLQSETDELESQLFGEPEPGKEVVKPKEILNADEKLANLKTIGKAIEQGINCINKKII